MNKYQQIDVWWCPKCQVEWRHPSVPHENRCPKCGEGGWWRRFAAPEETRRAISTDAVKEVDPFYYRKPNA